RSICRNSAGRTIWPLEETVVFMKVRYRLTGGSVKHYTHGNSSKRRPSIIRRKHVALTCSGRSVTIQQKVVGSPRRVCMQTKTFCLSAVPRIPALLVLSAFTLLAQRTTQLTGRITDPTDAVVPEADVTVTNEDTGLRRETKSNELGYYVVPLLQP